MHIAGLTKIGVIMDQGISSLCTMRQASQLWRYITFEEWTVRTCCFVYHTYMQIVLYRYINIYNIYPRSSACNNKVGGSRMICYICSYSQESQDIWSSLDGHNQVDQISQQCSAKLQLFFFSKLNDREESCERPTMVTNYYNIVATWRQELREQRPADHTACTRGGTSAVPRAVRVRACARIYSPTTVLLIDTDRPIHACG